VKTQQTPQIKRSPPALDGWTKATQTAPECLDGLDARTKNALLNIEHAPTRKMQKRLATQLYYALYGKPEDLSPYYAEGAPPITGVDVNGKTYSF
jgi:hypothetical protein